MMISAARVVFRLSHRASREASLPRLSMRSLGGVLAKIATTGRIRKSTASASDTVRTTTNGPRRLIGSARRRWPEARVLERLRALAGEQAVDEVLRALRVRGAVDDGGGVGDVGLQVLRQLDRLELVAGGDHVGDVDEPGVDRALRELADDSGDVGLER